jgi:hypothetical protein
MESKKIEELRALCDGSGIGDASAAWESRCVIAEARAEAAEAERDRLKKMLDPDYSAALKERDRLRGIVERVKDWFMVWGHEDSPQQIWAPHAMDDLEKTLEEPDGD